MHGTPVPYTNKVLMIDRTDVGPSKLFLNGKYAHAGEYDLTSNTIRPISVPSNTWCAAGAYLSDGTIINNGGGDGSGGVAANSGIRTFNTGGNLVHNSNTQVTRWYPTAHVLADGRVMMVGGSDLTGTAPKYNQDSYEFFPSDGLPPHRLELLSRPSVAPAFLYPFMHLLPDGRMFIFAARSSVLLDYKADMSTNLPDLPGNLCNYPYAGASILLPLNYLDSYKPKIMICGGGNGQNPSTPASSSCGTIDLSVASPGWTMSSTPSPRVMGYLVFLLDGTCLYTGGGTAGFSGYSSSNSPNLEPSIYDPINDTWQSVQSQSSIPRVYHSTANLVPDGRILLYGSNPRANYDFSAPAPQNTQTAVDAFSPWYIGNPNRSSIQSILPGATYGGTFTVLGSIGGATVDPTKIRVAFINPAFAIHTVSMSQCYVRLELAAATGNSLTVRVPSNDVVLPPGPYLCTVLYKGVPSEAKWIGLH